MEEGDHSSIDIKKLADSFRRKFKKLYPLSQECCIFRVPETIRRLNPSDYTPKMVSIGPIHHGSQELQAMEEHKIRYLQHFLRRTEVNIEDFLSLIEKTEGTLRSFYAENIKFESEDFVRIILVDAVFLIEFCLRGYRASFTTDDDRIFRKPWLTIAKDLWLVENQLPLFILSDLFDLAKTATYGDYYKGLSLLTISSWLRKDVLDYVPIENNFSEDHFSGAKHFLDWLRLCLQPSQLPNETELLNKENMPSATEIHQAGVKLIKSKSSKSLLDVKFNEGILEVPFLKVYDPTEPLFQNILVFENMYGSTHYFNDYILMMSYLVSTTKDAELLIENRIMGSRSSEGLSTILQNLNKNCVWYRNFQFSDVVESLKKHCKYPCNKWKAILKQKYFNTPWAIISVIAAVILLVLTFIQTTCSIIAL